MGDERGSKPLPRRRWEAYAIEFAASNIGRRSAEKAGYGDDAKSKEDKAKAWDKAHAFLTKKPEVQDRINFLRNKHSRNLQHKTTTTRANVLKNLEAVVEKALADNDKATALRGLELQGRSLGMWQDKLQIQQDPLDQLDAAALGQLLVLLKSNTVAALAGGNRATNLGNELQDVEYQEVKSLPAGEDGTDPGEEEVDGLW